METSKAVRGAERIRAGSETGGQDTRTRKRITGDIGEEAACGMLVREGMRIICRNFSCRTGEIDIVAFDPDAGAVVFAEVKTRNSAEYGLPCEFVGKEKQRRLRLTAEYYLLRNPGLRRCPLRMDIVEILQTDKGLFGRHIRNAF
ncbi:MAG: YraN family protein [Firmicutes bacterium]|nr:YraN family protein [Bacillota bacterium]